MHNHRKSWTQQEDQTLKYLKEQIDVKKWSVIATIMQKQFYMQGKTGKKCRQRYINHLSPMVENSKWNEEEDQLLLKLHQQYGNKWSAIAQNFDGKSENTVKNRFYSKIRKIVRKLNNFIVKKQNLGLFTISQAVISKMIQACESRFKAKSSGSEQWTQFCLKTIEKMYNLKANSHQKEIDQEQCLLYVQIIKQISKFQLHFKKRKIQKKQHQEDYKVRIKPIKNRQIKNRQNIRLKNNGLNQSILKQSNLDESSIRVNEHPQQELQLINQAEINSNQFASIYEQQLKSNLITFDSYELFQKSADHQMFSLPQEQYSIFNFQDF